MSKKLTLVVAMLLLVLPFQTEAQITIPHVFSSGSVISSSQVNANFSTLGSNACNRSACVLTGLLQGTSATFSSTLAVTGAVTLSSTLSVSGASTLAAVASGAITASGNIQPATGATYNSGASAARWLTVYTGALDASGDILDSTGNVTINDALDVSGAVSLNTTLSVTGNTTLNGTLLVQANSDSSVTHSLVNVSTGTSALVALTFVNNTGTVGTIQLTGGNFTGSPNDLLLLNAHASGTMRIINVGSGGISFSGSRVNTNTSQPGFLAFNSADDGGLSSGAFTVQYDSEVYDNNSNFASNTFTAPVTGTYLLCAQVYYGVINSGTVFTRIVTSNRSYQVESFESNAPAGVSSCVFADMDTADTAVVQASFIVVGSTSVISGSGTPYVTYFSGRLVL